MTVFTEMTPRITGMTLQSTEMTPNPYFKKISPQIYLINVLIIVNNLYRPNCKTEND